MEIEMVAERKRGISTTNELFGIML